MRAYNDQAAVPLTARSHAEVTGFLADLDLIDPGLVQLHRWRAGTGNPGTIRNWRYLGLLTPIGGTPRRPLYNLADILNAYTEACNRK